MAHRIGIIGYSAQEVDTEKALSILCAHLYEDRIMQHSGEEVVIVSGLTNLGIPGLAYQCARVLGLTTVGVACAKAHDYECYPVDHEIIIGEEWGDESETFLMLIDELVRVGGGAQSKAEYAAFTGPKTYYELDVLSAASAA